MTQTIEDTGQIRSLTAREREIAARLAIGRTCSEIGLELSISIRTCDTHRGNILRKLELRNTVELAHWALRTGLVQLQPRPIPSAAAEVQ